MEETRITTTSTNLEDQNPATSNNKTHASPITP